MGGVRLGRETLCSVLRDIAVEAADAERPKIGVWGSLSHVPLRCVVCWSIGSRHVSPIHVPHVVVCRFLLTTPRVCARTCTCTHMTPRRSGDPRGVSTHARIRQRASTAFNITLSTCQCPHYPRPQLTLTRRPNIMSRSVSWYPRSSSSDRNATSGTPPLFALLLPPAEDADDATPLPATRSHQCW